MLLPGYADRQDLRALRGLESGETRADRIDPPLGALLAAPVVRGDQFQRMAMGSDDLARLRIVGEQLDALGPDIQSDEQAHARLSAGADRRLPCRPKAGTTAT